MTPKEFIIDIKSKSAIILPTSSMRALELTQNSLQQMRAAMLPMPLIDFYTTGAGAVMLGDSAVLGPDEIDRAKSGYSLPSITQINRDISGIPSMRGRTVFGRNSLFWFGFDTFGYFYMLDILNLEPLRKYDDLFRAMTDCLVVGKV